MTMGRVKQLTIFEQDKEAFREQLLQVKNSLLQLREINRELSLLPEDGRQLLNIAILNINDLNFYLED